MTMRDGALAVIAVAHEGECPPPGARYMLRSTESQARHGVVAVDAINEDGKIRLTLAEMEPDSEAFWNEAHRRAVTDWTPKHLELLADPLLLDLTERVEN